MPPFEVQRPSPERRRGRLTNIERAQRELIDRARRLEPHDRPRVLEPLALATSRRGHSQPPPLTQSRRELSQLVATLSQDPSLLRHQQSAEVADFVQDAFVSGSLWAAANIRTQAERSGLTEYTAQQTGRRMGATSELLAHQNSQEFQSHQDCNGLVTDR